MQEFAFDYFTLSVGNGCCLNCYDAHEGCLCYNCKCKKCFWYSPQTYDTEKGSCDMVEKLKEEKKKEFLEKKEKIAQIVGGKLKVLHEQNKEIEKKIKKEGKIPNWYSCQECGMEFVTEEELEITKGTICDICSGKLGVDNGKYN